MITPWFLMLPWGGPVSDPLALPGLIAFWDFQEPTGAPRMARGPFGYSLKDGADAPVERVDGGLFGPYAARFDQRRFLFCARAECPALDRHGPDAQVSVVAWVRRRRAEGDWCQAVAGMWNETRAKRQYCLFLNLGIWNSSQQVGAHVSRIGGPTPGYRYCMDAAIGATPVPYDAWHCVAITYDGEHARAYLDGRLDERGDRNPYHYPGGLFDGGEEGADFTVGQVDRSGEMGNAFVGDLGGLAVYDRALSDTELAALGGAG